MNISKDKMLEETGLGKILEKIKQIDPVQGAQVDRDINRLLEVYSVCMEKSEGVPEVILGFETEGPVPILGQILGSWFEKYIAMVDCADEDTRIQTAILLGLCLGYQLREHDEGEEATSAGTPTGIPNDAC